MAQKQTQQEEEVDLGSLFKIIGKGFKNLFSAIANFFIGVGHYFILLLIFFRKHTLKLGIAVLIGGALGFYLDFTGPPKYSSTMTVEPNFKSSQQLYQNIGLYSQVVKQRDYNFLAQTFNISLAEAKKLKGFSIKPIKNENEKYEFYAKFIEEIDTSTIRTINFKEFRKSFTVYDYKYHQIKVNAFSNTIFDKLTLPIISSVEENTYFKNQKKINDQNLLQNEKVLVKSLRDVDTLRKIYNEVLITEAQKSEPNTNISLSEGSKKTSEIDLFDQSLDLNEELIENNIEKARTTDIVNIISTFNKVGEKDSSIFKKMTFLMGVGFGLLMLVFILARQLDFYLKNYRT